MKALLVLMTFYLCGLCSVAADQKASSISTARSAIEAISIPLEEKLTINNWARNWWNTMLNGCGNANRPQVEIRTVFGCC